MSLWDFIGTHSAILAVAFPLLGAFLTPVVGRLGEKASRYVSFFFLSLASLMVAFMAVRVWDSGPLVYTLGYRSGSSIPQFFRIQLYVDGFGVFMAIIMAVVSLAVCMYSWAFVDRYTGQEKYYTLLQLVAVGSYGMVLTGDIFNLFVFFEISSMALCGLVAFRTERGESFEAAFKYMLYSTISGVLLLFAVGIFYGEYDLLNMRAIAEAMSSAGGASVLDKIALGLLVTVFSLKAGSVPMHMPTPDAYSEAPGGISAIFVAASQAGLYALFRTSFTIYGHYDPISGAFNLDTYTLGWIVIVLGILSMFIGVTMALVQKDIKRLMAYHAISQTGYMFLGVGVGIAVLSDPVKMAAFGVDAMRGGIFHIINHALYKGLLFLTAGAVFYRAQTRNLNEMHGLGHTMKYTMVFFMIGALAIAGIPPMNGFSSKLLIYESVYQFNPIIAAIAMLVSVLTLASFVKVFYSAFMGPRPENPPEEVPPSMLAGMTILVVLILFFSLFPGLIVTRIVDPAVRALVPYLGGV